MLTALPRGQRSHAAVGDIQEGADQDLQILMLEFLSKLFGDPATADVFYSNDLNVIVDTIIRETSDLPPGDSHVRPVLPRPLPLSPVER